MASKTLEEMLGALAAIRNEPIESAPSLSARREAFEARARAVPIPADLHISAASCNGVDADILTPPDAGEDIMLYLHGGGYCLGSARSHRDLAARIARAAQMRAFVPDYRLAPEHPYPAALEDALCVYAHIVENTGAAPAAIAGDSAGGGLALACLSAARDRGLPAARVAAVISPWTDLTMSGDSIVERASIDPFLTPEGLQFFARAYAGGEDPSKATISPLFDDFANFPPLLVEVGSNEILYDDAVRLAEKTARAGVETRLEISDGLFHVYHAFSPAPEAIEGAERVGAFLKSHAGNARAA